MKVSFPAKFDHEGFHIIHTAGYGNKAPDKFFPFLKEKEITIIFDVRRQCVPWDPEYVPGTIQTSLNTHNILYSWYPILGKYQSESFEHYRYSISLTGSRRLAFTTLAESIISIAQSNGKPCLLCAEGKPFKSDNKTLRCHRVPLAQKLAKHLGSNRWTISHLIME